MNISLVPPDGVPQVWPQVRLLLLPAVRRSGGRFTLRTTYDALRLGRFTLWIAFEDGLGDIRAAAVTAPAEYPAKRMLCIILWGGRKMPLWESPLHDRLVRYARDLGLDGLEGYGRRGLVRKGAQHGWRETAAVIDRDLY